MNHKVGVVTGPLHNRRQWLGAAAGAALAVSTPVWAQSSPTEAALEAQAPPLPPVGSLLQVPRIDMLGGGVFDMGASAPQPTLVYWWASTCPFCAQQSPAMEKLWQQQKSKGWRMVALSIDKQPEDAKAYLQRKGYTFPAAWVSPAWRKAYPKPRGLPITLLAGRNGKLLLAEKGQMFEEDVLAMADLA